MITDGEWTSIRSLIQTLVSEQTGQSFMLGHVLKTDDANKLVYVKELVDVPIPVVAFFQESQFYDMIYPWVPIAVPLPYFGTSLPADHVWADGASLLVADWPQLFNEIGYQHGGSGANFNAPNMLGRVPVGRDPSQTEFDALGEAGGEKTHALALSEAPSHSHTVNSHSHGGGNHGHGITDPTHDHLPGSFMENYWFQDSAGPLNIVNVGSGGQENLTYGTLTGPRATGITVNPSGTVISAESPGTNAQGGGSGHNNLQPYRVCNWIVRGKAPTQISHADIQKRQSTIKMPVRDDKVLLGLERGSQRLPRCLGVIQSTGYAFGSDDEAVHSG